MQQWQRFAVPLLGIVLLLGGVGMAVRAGMIIGMPTRLHQLAADSLELNSATKHSGCIAHDSMPDPACTPGAVFEGRTREELCAFGYSKKVRNVSQSMKDRVYAAYGVRHHASGEYQVDHHISLSLGGSNDFSNLWPEAALPKPGYHEKDAVEHFLYAKLCEGELSVKEVQALVSRHWKDVYVLLHDSPFLWHNDQDDDE